MQYEVRAIAETAPTQVFLPQITQRAAWDDAKSISENFCGNIDV